MPTTGSLRPLTRQWIVNSRSCASPRTWTHQVRRQRQMTSLRILLQTRLRILLLIARTDFVQTGLVPGRGLSVQRSEYHLSRKTPPINASTVSARIDLATETAAFSSPRPEAQTLAQLKLAGDLRQRVRRAPASRAYAGSYRLHRHEESDDTAHSAITKLKMESPKKFQALIMFAAGTAVRVNACCNSS